MPDRAMFQYSVGGRFAHLAEANFPARKGGWCETHGGYRGDRCGGSQYDGRECGVSSVRERCGNNGPSCRRSDCPWPEGLCVERSETL